MSQIDNFNMIEMLRSGLEEHVKRVITEELVE